MSKRAILIDIVPLDSGEDRAYRLQEFQSLLATLGGVHIISTLQLEKPPDYGMFIDADLRTKIYELADAQRAELLIFNNVLKPRQIFLLSESFQMLKMAVWDRIDLILAIFTLHATTVEAKLQIDLAKIRHMGPRIFGMGMTLSRQGGGIGTSGIGETNIEIMKRHLKEQERRIMKKLEKYEQVKTLQRQRRERQNFSMVSIIGYTNAGKSLLMRALTHKENIVVENALFATLDTKIGRVFFPEENRLVLIADTIGFISNLPPKLIAAFTSTLSEAAHSDLLLHVADVSDPKCEWKIGIVDSILEELGLSHKKQILVFNKSDLLPAEFDESVLQQKYESRSPIFLSALEKTNLEELKTVMKRALFKKRAKTSGDL